MSNVKTFYAVYSIRFLVHKGKIQQTMAKSRNACICIIFTILRKVFQIVWKIDKIWETFLKIEFFQQSSKRLFP
jgi:hypothetical protein